MSRVFCRKIKCLFLLILKMFCGNIKDGDYMNVFDFDNTIYNGESTLDFYFFCVKHHPRLIRFVFIVLIKLVKYKMCLISEDELLALCKKYVKAFLADCPDAKQLAEIFWEKNICRIKNFYKEIHNENDIVISASFGFMLRPAMSKLGIKRFVCSEVNLENGSIDRLCFRKNKLHLFKEMYGDEVIENFYTDSLNDLSFMKLATCKAYLVKGNSIRE